jgi:hypothetical protein
MQALKCGCAEPLLVDDRYIGKRVQCPVCQAVLVVPERTGDQVSVPTGIKTSPRQPVLLTEQASQDDSFRWRLDAQLQRPTLLDRRAGWMFAFGGLLLFAGVVVGIVIWCNVRLEQSKIEAARAQMKVLAQACAGYRLGRNRWPEKLEALLERDPCGGACYHEDGLKPITDPWGKIYGYDPDDPLGPLIFCTTRDGICLTQRL